MLLQSRLWGEATEYTCRVAADIVGRYDIDGFHIDDYFYPYPVAGKQIPDQALLQTASKRIQKHWRLASRQCKPIR